jgi:hypothetical protein
LSFVRAHSQTTIKVRNPFNLSLSALWPMIKCMTVQRFPTDLCRASFRQLEELTVEFAGHTTIELQVPRGFQATNVHTVVVTMAKGCRPLAAPKNTTSFFRKLAVPVVVSEELYSRIKLVCPGSTFCCTRFGPSIIRTPEGKVLQQCK